jgi:N-acetylglucosaminyldiphosphoundecaprenol N-acetyl-beta-D-mannosaminyltransferase
MTNDAKILGIKVAPTSYQAATASIIHWAQKPESRYICVANVHVVMEAYDSPDFREVINSADLVTPDGMPLVWTLRALGVRGQTRVYGPELTLRLIGESAQEDIPIGLYGGSPGTLQRLTAVLKQRYPALNIAYSYSPPFRPLTAEEDQAISQEINASGAGILLVGLGCPKQERWMAEHKGRVQAVMVGVGAAFDFIAGVKKQAPHWMQENGLEWLYRLGQEPGRLWRRYLYYNPRFAALVFLQLLFKKK